MISAKSHTTKTINKGSFLNRVRIDFKRNKTVYLIMLPMIAYYILFCYVPMYGAVIAFKDYAPALGILKSPWVGLKHFTDFFGNPDFVRIFRNTLVISISELIFSFPAPIILALMFNEIKNKKFKSVAQTISYLPHFISLVVVCSLIKQFVTGNGIIQQLIEAMGGSNISLLSRVEMFVPVYVISGIWQDVGWGTIIYLAALSGIDRQLYEAAEVDGVGKFKQILYVTLPGIAPTIIVMLILKVGSLLSVGYEKIILLYNPLIYESSDVISSYVYRIGIQKQSWSYSTAVGLFNSVINFIIVVTANKLSAKFSDTSLW